MGQKNIPNQISQPKDGISEESVTQTSIDTFERLPSEFTRPFFNHFCSESASIIFTVN